MNVLLKKQRLWPWFVAGFATTFLAIAMCKTIYAMKPSGDGAVATRLWRFYLDEIPRSFDVQTLGPATVNQTALLPLALVHLAVSITGGVAVSWVACGLRSDEPESLDDTNDVRNLESSAGCNRPGSATEAVCMISMSLRHGIS